MKKTLRYLRPVASIASLALFAYALRRAGTGTILDGARALGGGFILLILLSGLRHALRTAAWHASIEPGTSRPGLLTLFGLRLLGEGLNVATPAGPLLGESAKAWTASRWMPASSSASSVLIENLIYGLAAGLFVLSGAMVVLVAISPHLGLGSWMVMACLLASFLVAWTLLRRGTLLIAPLLDRLPPGSRVKRFLERYKTQIETVEAEVYRFFRARRTAFLGILGLEFLTNFTGLAEAYLVLKVTTPHASLLTCYLVEVTNRLVQLFLPFVPFGLGVEEGAAAGTLKSLGYSVSQGVSLAVLRRARTLFWSGIGLLLAAHYLGSRSPLREGAQYETAHS
jgi:glycosyltransferase 2 family protein